MAGRTIQQAMAYLGLSEQGEQAHEGQRGGRHLEGYQDGYEAEDRFDETDEVFMYQSGTSEAFDTLPTRDVLAPALKIEATSNARAEEESLAPNFENQGDYSAEAEAPFVPASTPKISYVDANESEEELRRITTIHPRSYNDAKIIGESFRENIPVIMNVTDMGESEAKRLVDFSAGLAFALHGSIERVTDKVFLLTPANLEVLGAEGAEVPVALDSEASDIFNQG